MLGSPPGVGGCPASGDLEPALAVGPQGHAWPWPMGLSRQEPHPGLCLGGSQPSQQLPHLTFGALGAGLPGSAPVPRLPWPHCRLHWAPCWCPVIVRLLLTQRMEEGLSEHKKGIRANALTFTPPSAPLLTGRGLFSGGSVLQLVCRTGAGSCALARQARCSLSPALDPRTATAAAASDPSNKAESSRDWTRLCLTAGSAKLPSRFPRPSETLCTPCPGGAWTLRPRLQSGRGFKCCGGHNEHEWNLSPHRSPPKPSLFTSEGHCQPEGKAWAGVVLWLRVVAVLTPGLTVEPCHPRAGVGDDGGDATVLGAESERGSKQ